MDHELTVTEVEAAALAWAKSRGISDSVAVQYASVWHSAGVPRCVDTIPDLLLYLERRFGKSPSSAQLMTDLLRVSLGQIPHACGLDHWPLDAYGVPTYVDGCLACEILRDVELRTGDPRGKQSLSYAQRSDKISRDAVYVTSATQAALVKVQLGVMASGEGARVAIEGALDTTSVDLSRQQLQGLHRALESLLGAAHLPGYAATVHSAHERNDASLERAYIERLEAQLRENERFMRRFPVSPVTHSQIAATASALASSPIGSEFERSSNSRH